MEGLSVQILIGIFLGIMIDYFIWRFKRVKSPHNKSTYERLREIENEGRSNIAD